MQNNYITKIKNALNSFYKITGIPVKFTFLSNNKTYFAENLNTQYIHDNETDTYKIYKSLNSFTKIYNDSLVFIDDQENLSYIFLNYINNDFEGLFAIGPYLQKEKANNINNIAKNLLKKGYSFIPRIEEKQSLYIGRLLLLLSENPLPECNYTYGEKIDFLPEKSQKQPLIPLTNLIESAGTIYSKIIKNTIDHVDHNIKDNLQVNEIAHNFKITSDYLSKQFTKEVGIKLSEYINKKKMELAIFLLINSEMKILDIAVDLGYNSLSYFCRVFKKVTGETPANYRSCFC